MAQIGPQELYDELLNLYGPQGWWPLLGRQSGECRYHSRRYPLRPHHRFEVAVGAILTQNTQFHPNVDRALRALHFCCDKKITPQAVLALSNETLQEAIRPAGYFRQKSNYLCNMARFFTELGRRSPTRCELLAVVGVGPETADSILLYAFNEPVFVVDAYTRRILEARGAIPAKSSYDAIQAWFMRDLPRDAQLFNEYHALLVAHAKELRAAAASAPR